MASTSGLHGVLVPFRSLAGRHVPSAVGYVSGSFLVGSAATRNGSASDAFGEVGNCCGRFRTRWQCRGQTHQRGGVALFGGR